LYVASAIDVIVTVLFNVLHNNKLMPTCIPRIVLSEHGIL